MQRKSEQAISGAMQMFFGACDRLFCHAWQINLQCLAVFSAMLGKFFWRAWQIFLEGGADFFRGLSRFGHRGAKSSYGRLTFFLAPLVVPFLMALALAACVGAEQFPAPPVQMPEERELTLLMQIPGTNIPATFAPSDGTGENVVKTVDILVFEVDAAGAGAYLRHIPVRSVEAGNSTSKQLSVRLDATTDVRLIVLANVERLFSADMCRLLEMDSAAGNVSEDAVLNRLVFGMQSPLPTGSSSYGFPMYGRSEPVAPGRRQAVEVEMLRAVARIDIANDISQTRRSIDSVYIFNTKNLGFVAPALDRHGNIAEAPHVPPAARANTLPFGYVFEPNMGVSTPSMEGVIYVAEDLQQEGDATFIVLKTLGASDAEAPQFYRVDIASADAEAVAIRRNFRYRIFIRRITGEGYASAAEAAMAGKRKAIDFEMEMNELGLGNIIFNDRYKLAVSELELGFDAGGSISGKPQGELRVYTTYPVWTASVEASEGFWLSFEGEAEDGSEAEFPSSVHSLIIRARANNSGKARTGKIRLRAGSLKQEILIIQYSN